MVAPLTAKPNTGYSHRSVVVYRPMSCLMMVAAVANRQRQIAARERSTRPATRADGPDEWASTYPPNAADTPAINTGMARKRTLIL